MKSRRIFKAKGQPWREDSSNLDLGHTRNRVRHTLLPLLEREFNPAIRQTLADLADIAQAENDYWDNELSSLLPRLIHEGKSQPERTQLPAVMLRAFWRWICPVYRGFL